MMVIFMSAVFMAASTLSLHQNNFKSSFDKCCSKEENLGVTKDGSIVCTKGHGHIRVSLNASVTMLVEYLENCNGLCADILENAESTYLVFFDCQKTKTNNSNICAMHNMYNNVTNNKMKEVANSKCVEIPENSLSDIGQWNNLPLAGNYSKISQQCFDIQDNRTEFKFDILFVNDTNYEDGEPRHIFYCSKLRIQSDTHTKRHADGLFILVKLDTIKESPRKFNGIAIPMFLSSIGLLLTFVGHITLPELKSFLGRLLAIYCLMFGFAHIIMFWMLLYFPFTFCNFRAFLLYFLMQSSFSWLNVICYEMWTFLGKPCRPLNIVSNKENHSKKFLIYNLYAWSYSLFWTSITFAAWKHDFLPEYISVKLASNTCLLDHSKTGNYSIYLFFYLPDGVLALVNAILYAMIVKYITEVKKELNKLGENLKEQKFGKGCATIDENFFMFLKLGVLMGMIRIFKVPIGLINDRCGLSLNWLETIINYLLNLQGFFAFCIFMLKKKVLKSVRRLSWLDSV